MTSPDPARARAEKRLAEKYAAWFVANYLDGDASRLTSDLAATLSAKYIADDLLSDLARIAADAIVRVVAARDDEWRNTVGNVVVPVPWHAIEEGE